MNSNYIYIRKYSRTLRVELPYQDTAFLHPTFSEFVEIESIDLKPDFAIITFIDKLAAENAIKSELIIGQQKLILSLVEE